MKKSKITKDIFKLVCMCNFKNPFGIEKGKCNDCGRN